MQKEIPLRRGGYYHLDSDRIYPSVTTILRVLDKGFGFEWWMKNGVAEIALANPDLSAKEVLAKFTLEGKGAAIRGTAVHAAIEHYIEHSSMPVVDEAYLPYLRAFENWVSSANPKFLDQEILTYSDDYKYAGRCDCVAEINGEVWILDWKTNDKGVLYPTVGIQLVGYREALISMEKFKPTRMGAVCLTCHGEFVFKEFTSTIEDFLNVYKVWEWTKEQGV